MVDFHFEFSKKYVLAGVLVFYGRNVNDEKMSFFIKIFNSTLISTILLDDKFQKIEHI